MKLQHIRIPEEIILHVKDDIASGTLELVRQQRGMKQIYIDYYTMQQELCSRLIEIGVAPERNEMAIAKIQEGLDILRKNG